MPTIAAMPDKSFLTQWPYFRFSIERIYSAACRTAPATAHDQIADKLLDLKLHYGYLLTIHEHFYRGATLIVGNGNFAALNPNTISLLRSIHYRVYLLSIVIEQALDLIGLIQTGQIPAHRKNKWQKIIATIQLSTSHLIISSGDAALFLSFKDRFRTAEMHKFSMVRGLMNQDSWTHLQEEELAVGRLLANVFNYYNDLKDASGDPTQITGG
ncbi:MAG: hypothetical protein AUJ18_05365 [Candidatus Hydrogenedentes bacterium CG1_02_42_14]|nr:MAG: hypothetical protein AUJ18_05365 [Candidatus Hydrogenedentes bacterium CG1_02_42_14]